MGVRAICTRVKVARAEKRIQKRDKLWRNAKDKLEERWLSQHRRPLPSQLTLGLDPPHRIQVEELFKGYNPDCPYSPRSIRNIVEKGIVQGYSYTKSNIQRGLIKCRRGLGLSIWLGSLFVPIFLAANTYISAVVAVPIGAVSWVATSAILLHIDNKIEKKAIEAFGSWFNADPNNSFISSLPNRIHEHSH